MKVIRVLPSARLAHSPAIAAPVRAALGNFDGVHLGHQALLARLKSAPGTTALLSFTPHPAVVLGKAPPERGLLTSFRQKVRILQDLGVDCLFCIRFSRKVAALSAAEFIDRFLIGCCRVDHLVFGPDAALGRGREADAARMVGEMRVRGRSAEVCPELLVDGERVSSGRVRDLLARGDVGRAAHLLGRSFALDAWVGRGERRGSQIGIPTANLRVKNQITPLGGVYATRAVIAGKTYAAVTNIGQRPTFAGRGRTVEAHCLDYPGGDLYGQRVVLEFAARLRAEIRFPGAAELKAQIGRDIEQARMVLAGGVR